MDNLNKMFEEVKKFFEDVPFENSPTLRKEKKVFKEELDNIYQSSPKELKSSNIFNLK